MGLFSFLGDVASGVLGAAAGAVEWIGDRVGDAVECVSGIFGRRKSYQGTSAEEVVDVQRELKAFRNKIQKKARTCEEESISIVARGFDRLIEELEEVYPSEVEAVRKKREAVSEELDGTILEFIEQRVSENDPDFLELLEMQPGSAKTKAIDLQIKQIIKEAQQHFNDRLGDAMRRLNEDLGGRLTGELHRQEEQMKEETAIYEDLERRSRNGSIDLAQLEAEYRPVAEAEACIRAALAVK